MNNTLIKLYYKVSNQNVWAEYYITRTAGGFRGIQTFAGIFIDMDNTLSTFFCNINDDITRFNYGKMK